MEVIDLGLSDLEPVSFSLNDPGSGSQKMGVNFGPGIELLMNDKKKSASFSTKLDLGELNNLEDELNALSGETKKLNGFSTDGLFNSAANLFGLGPTQNESSPDPIRIDVTDSNIGAATRDSAGNTKTWDGFSKLNEIPLNDSHSAPSSAKMNDRERRRKKRLMLKKLEEWRDKGLVKHSSHFTIDSPYDEIEDEYESALEDKRKKDSVKLQGWWFMTFINSMEYANAVFNPFDLNLDGWGEQVSEDIDSYDEIFNELYEKYKGGKLAPEISLLLRIGFSACVLNMSNKMLSSSTPAFNDVLRQSPELMKMFTNATVNSMEQQNPAFAFANHLMQEQANKPRGPPPPAPVETKSQPAPPRPGMMYTEAPGNRPDIQAGRGAMFREQGVEMGQNYESVHQQKSVRMAPVGQTQAQAPMQAPMQSQQRPEMRGPQSTDIDNILSGLKTRTVNIHEETPNITMTAPDDDSMISISSLKDMQNASLPKRTNRRRNNSAKNTVSLDI
uniref:Uncharacterized protein n=1 Tax=viral metagenome TaxID=1070528 RepID=A0A6C0DNR6_9ZZZZ